MKESNPSKTRARTKRHTSVTIAFGYFLSRSVAQHVDVQSRSQKEAGFDRQISENARRMMDQGKQIFRYDTFGDEVYWTGKLRLHHAINHYDGFKNLSLTEQEKSDLVEYLKSL